MLDINSVVTKTDIVCAIFDTALPYRKELGNRTFRNKILTKARALNSMNEASVSVFYGIAKSTAIAEGRCEEFGRGIDEKVGKLLSIDAEMEAKIDAEIDRAIAIVQGDETIALQAGLKWKIVTSDGAFKKFTKTKKAGVELAKEGDLVLKVA